MNEKQEQFIQLRAQGKSYSDISAELGISKGSCSNWAKQYKREIEAAKLKATQLQEQSPAVKAKIIKAPVLSDTTEDFLFSHFLTEDFLDRYEKGEITPEEQRQIDRLDAEAEQIGKEDLQELDELLGAISKSPEEKDKALNQIIGIAASPEFIKVTTAIAQESHAKTLDDLSTDLSKELLPLFFDEFWKSFEEEVDTKGLPKEYKDQVKESFEAQKEKTIEKLKSPSTLFSKAFTTMLAGSGINNLSSINTLINKPDIDKITGNAILKDGDFSISIENYERTIREFKTSTNKLLAVCTILLTSSNNYREKNKDAINPAVTISLDEYMQLTGKKSTKANKDKLRREIKADLDTLRNTTIHWNEKGRESGKDWLFIPIIGGTTGIYKGNIIVTFSDKFAERLIQNAPILQYSLGLLKTDERNANVYPLGYKLLVQSSIDKNIKKGTANIISVKNLLKVCPDIPKYNEVKKTDRHPERRIQATLEKALDALPDFEWEYCNAKKQPLTDEQLECCSYSEYENLYIRFKWLQMPDQTERLKRKQKRIEKKAKEKQKRENAKLKAEAKGKRAAEIEAAAQK